MGSRRRRCWCCEGTSTCGSAITCKPPCKGVNAILVNSKLAANRTLGAVGASRRCPGGADSTCQHHPWTCRPPPPPKAAEHIVHLGGCAHILVWPARLPHYKAFPHLQCTFSCLQDRMLCASRQQCSLSSKEVPPHRQHKLHAGPVSCLPLAADVGPDGTTGSA